MSTNQPSITQRYLNPLDIHILPGYTIEVFVQGLNAPVNMVFDDNGNILIAESGELDGNARVMRITPNGYEVVAEGFNVPLTGVNYLNGDIYVSHNRVVSVILANGTRRDLITGLPSTGDYKNYQVVFGSDGRMYFGQGSATNSGVVGLDNYWAINHPYFHDFPFKDITLVGQNFVTYNFLTAVPSDYAFTGAFRPFGFPNKPNIIINGDLSPTSCIYRANLDGSNLEVYAWGVRNPISLKFDRYNRLFSSNRGYDERGSRPIYNSFDEFLLINHGDWYGFPDYSGGIPITNPRFTPDVGLRPEFLLANQPMVPPKPYALLEPHSTAGGFDFNYDPDFGPYGDAYLAQYGSDFPITTAGYPLPGVGRRIVKIDMDDGSVSSFAVNKSGLGASFTGGGGFERPNDVVFGPDGAMYVLDYGIASSINPYFYIPNTGVIWRISKS